MTCIFCESPLEVKRTPQGYQAVCVCGFRGPVEISLSGAKVGYTRVYDALEEAVTAFEKRAA